MGLSSIVDGYTASTSTTLSGNADVVLGAGTITLAASADTSSLRFNASQINYIGIGEGNTLTTGGILVGEGVGAHATYIDGGILRSNSTGLSFTTSDLVIVQNNTLGDLIITANIDNNLGGTNTSTSLTKSGAGTVILDTATHNYSGTTKVVEGTLHLRTGNINTAGQYTLGGGSTSGKFKIGNNSTSILSIQTGCKSTATAHKTPWSAEAPCSPPSCWMAQTSPATSARATSAAPESMRTTSASVWRPTTPR